MPIAIKCSSCSAAFAVKEELAGKRIRCVQCKEILAVPSSAKDPVKSNVPAAATASSGTPPIRQARRISAPPQPQSPPQAPPRDPAAVSSESGQPSVVRARVVQGPKDIQAEAIRHTAATLSAPPEDFETIRQKVLASFSQKSIDPVPVSASYRVGIVLVSLFMIMLPFVYVSLIGCVGWGIWYHAIHHTGIMSAAANSGSGRNAGRAVALAFLVYVTPIIAGSALIVFMLKPLFSKPSTDSGRRSLKPSEEPLLFEFVERICQAVHSPRPQRIDIDCNINASASFGRGLLSMVGNDLVLTLGMPLVAGLTMRQFGGVLAHEFGHFAQGAGMRLTYLIRSISHWFTRVVYERDSWDDKLAEWSQSLDIRIGWVLYATRLGVWLTRKILWVLMISGHLVGGYLLRQMEFDADRHEARLAGSRTFATTARQLSVLNVAYQGALSDLGGFHREGRLGDNLPKLILLNVDQLPEKIHAKIDEMILESKTGLFDTHPSDRERIASASLEKTDGIFQLRLPAAHLFKRFDFLSRAVTWDFYREIFGEALKKSDLHPVDQLMELQKIQQETWKALRRFFQGNVPLFRPLQSPTIALSRPQNPSETIALMKSSRATMLAEADRFSEAWKKYDECDTRLIETTLADLLLKAGVKVRKADFPIPLTNAAEIEVAQEAAEVRQGKLEARLLPFENAAADRLYSGLQLARVPEVVSYLREQGIVEGELDQLLQIFSHVNERLGQLLVIRNAQIGMGKLLSLLNENSNNEKLLARIRERMVELNDHIVHLRESLEDTPYPFNHAKADISVAEYLLKTLPDPENPGDLYQAADAIGHGLPPLQARVTGRLCQIAEMVETRFGLPPLEDPPEKEEEEEEEEEEES